MSGVKEGIQQHKHFSSNYNVMPLPHNNGSLYLLLTKVSDFSLRPKNKT